jgi:hypothetical protein
VGRQFSGSAGLANAQLAYQHHQPPLTGSDFLQNQRQFGHLPLAAHEHTELQSAWRRDLF